MHSVGDLAPIPSTGHVVQCLNSQYRNLEETTNYFIMLSYSLPMKICLYLIPAFVTPPQVHVSHLKVSDEAVDGVPEQRTLVDTRDKH